MSATPPTSSSRKPSATHARAGSPTAPTPVGPPTKHQLAVMIWVAVFPTLTVLNLTIGPWLQNANPVLRTFVLATVAVPIVIYALMPRLHRIRVHLLTRCAWRQIYGQRLATSPNTSHQAQTPPRPRHEPSSLVQPSPPPSP